MGKAKQIKQNFENAIINKFGISSQISKVVLLSYALDKNQPLSNLKKGCFYFHNNYVEKALDCFLKTLTIDPNNVEAIINIGYLNSFYLNEQKKEKVFAVLNDIYKRNEKTENLMLFRLYCSVYLSLDWEMGKKYSDLYYIKKIIQSNVKTFPKKPIYFIHIPKCSGTSITELFNKKFYKDSSIPLPDYNTVHLLKFSVNERMNSFPFLKSTHMNYWEIFPNEKLRDNDQVFCFTIFRDPIKRVLSMYRQSVKGAKNGKRLHRIPQYGQDWNYWNYDSFSNWFKSVLPKALLQKQLSTFSKSFDPEQAENLVRNLDYYVAYDSNVGSMDELLSKAGLEAKGVDLPVGKNSSPKKIDIPDYDENLLRHYLRTEYELMKKLKNEL